MDEDFTTLKCGFPKFKMRSDIKKLEKKNVNTTKNSTCWLICCELDHFSLPNSIPYGWSSENAANEENEINSVLNRLPAVMFSCIRLSFGILEKNDPSMHWLSQWVRNNSMAVLILFSFSHSTDSEFSSDSSSTPYWHNHNCLSLL